MDLELGEGRLEENVFRGGVRKEMRLQQVFWCKSGNEGEGLDLGKQGEEGTVHSLPGFLAGRSSCWFWGLG